VFSIGRVRSFAGGLPFLGAGFVLAVVTCGGIVEERLSAGSPGVAFTANALVTFAAILALCLVQGRARLSRAALPQAVGAACGIVAIHLALRIGIFHAAPWMSERPPQLVNDAVAVGSTLAVVWACARQLNTRLLVGTLVVLTVYRSTARFWHLDLPPHGFLLTVQDCVVAQCVAGALALAIYREMSRDAA
jgi:hypothetical protein